MQFLKNDRKNNPKVKGGDTEVNNNDINDGDNDIPVGRAHPTWSKYPRPLRPPCQRDSDLKRISCTLVIQSEIRDTI